MPSPALHSGAPCAEDIQPRDTSFRAFAQEVEESLNGFAKSKGYTSDTVERGNQLLTFCESLGISHHHSVAEAIYKLTEHLKTPRRVLLVKACGWMFLEWRRTTNP